MTPANAPKVIRCPDAEPAVLETLRRKLADQRVPFTGTFELTHRCNLRCVHCYGGDQVRIRRAARKELGALQWQDITDQAVAAGCVDLLFTGGEPFLRADFPEIYEHAKRKGMIVTIFTNGTHLPEAIRETLFEWPPYLVEITLYGATPATHDRVTQMPGSFRKTLRNIEQLQATGVRVGLKTVLMLLNAAEMPAIEKLAAELGVSWRLDAAVFSCLSRADSGGRANRCAGWAEPRDPIELRVDPAQAVEIECRDGRRRKALHDTWLKWKGRWPESDRLYTCGAGLTGFHIDPYGFMQPCLMATGYRAHCVELGFAEAWRRVGNIREIPAPASFPCRNCDAFSLCSGCPALFDLENGDAAQPSGYICSLGRERLRTLLAGC